MRPALCFLFALAGLLCPAAGTCFAGGRCMAPVPGLGLALVSALTVTPGVISFPPSAPDSGTVAASSGAALSWSVEGGSPLQTWNVSVQSDSETFAGCTNVPVSAVTVACASATVEGGGGTGACGASATLSTVARQVAGGAQGSGTQNYRVQLNYLLAESWRYVANPSCTLTVTYTVNAL